MDITSLMELEPGDRVRVMDEACARALSTPDGLVLLVRLLEAAKVLDPTVGEAEQAVANFGKWIMALAGINSTARLVAAATKEPHDG